MQLSIIVSARWTSVVAGIVGVLLSHIALAVDSVAELQIKAIISSAYDKPGHKVETSPIAVAEQYAIADWVQGKRGGRALLHRVNGKWVIMACGADGLKEQKMLIDAGISKKTAYELVERLEVAEKKVSPDRIKKFSLFGTKDDPVTEDQHHTHTD